LEAAEHGDVERNLFGRVTLMAAVGVSKATADLPDRLAEAGVRLVFVDAFPSAKIDGGTMYVDGYPVIGLSGRGKRLDKVLFTLLHEIAHILRGHVDADHYIVEEIDDADPTQNAQEREADVAAAELRFPDGFPRIRHGSVDHGSTRSPRNSASRASSSSVTFNTGIVWTGAQRWRRTRRRLATPLRSGSRRRPRAVDREAVRVGRPSARKPGWTVETPYRR
jgi:hypothetical protein